LAFLLNRLSCYFCHIAQKMTLKFVNHFWKRAEERQKKTEEAEALLKRKKERQEQAARERAEKKALKPLKQAEKKAG